MKRIGFLVISFLAFYNVSLFAQGNEIDAYTLSTHELGGTARSMAMGGAFGALGGDLSVISNNPAGLGIYRSSEVSGTLDLSRVNTSTDWTGVKTDLNKSHFTMSNFAFSLYFPTGMSDVQNWSVGFSYNRVKNFKRSYRMVNNGQDYSMSDYAAWRATNAFGHGNGITLDELTLTDNYDPYNNRDLAGHWLPVLGYESGMYDHFVGRSNEYQSAFGRKSGGEWIVDSPTRSSLRVNENGYADEYNIGFGMNVSGYLYVGASFSVTDIDYRYSSFYEDFFNNRSSKGDYLYLENRLNTKGTAFSANFGVISVIDMLRFGVAYNSPRWYDMTDYYNAWAETDISEYETPKMENETPRDSYSEYRFQTPSKWIFSCAAVVGQSALVSVDYEMTDYHKMLFSDRNGEGYGTNDYIKEDFTWGHTLKIGAEIKATRQFAIRAGYMMQTSPMLKQLAKNDVEVIPAGTLPHFTVTSNPTNYFTAGIGYRFTPNFFMDLAWVYRYNNSDAYAFSNTYDRNNKVDVFAPPAKLQTNSTRLALTIGLKF